MSHSLEIEKVVCRCRVPRDVAGSETLRRKLDEIAAQHLPRVLAEILEPLCPENDDSVWMIRRLDVKLGADLSWDTGKLTSCWAASVARSLFKTMQGDRDGHSVFHYRSRSEYLAAFVTDLAEGTAWNKWQYESFAGLRLLSSSAVLRTLLIDETDNTLAALAALTSTSLHRAVAMLLLHDAERVWSHLVSEQLQPGSDVLSQILRLRADDYGGLRIDSQRDALAALLRVMSGKSGGQLRQFRREATGAVQAVAARGAVCSETSGLEWADMRASLLSGHYH